MALYFAPAGAFPSYTSGILLYYRILPSNQHDFSNPPTGVWMPNERAARIFAGDRELLVCTRPDKWYPTSCDNSWDGCLNTSFYQKDGIGDHYLDLTLISVHNGIKANLWNRKFIGSEKIKILGDSGGAQVKMRVTPYLGPEEVIDWNNKVTDYAMALDVPPSPPDILYDDVVQAAALIQKRHNKVFTERKAPHLKLVNVMHGHTLPQQKAWYETVRDDGFCAWASGTDNWNAVLSWLQCLMVPMYPTIKAYKQGRGDPKDLPHDSSLFHLFGITGRTLTPSLAWLGRYVPRVTIDSTSWLFSVKTKTAEILPPSNNLKAILVGHTGGAKAFYQPMPCSCEVCSIVRWTGVYNLDPSLKTTGLLATHNWLSIARNVESWNEEAQLGTKDQYQALIMKKFQKNVAQRILDTNNYIDCVANEGLDVAQAEFTKLLDATKFSVQDVLEQEDSSTDILDDMLAHDESQHQQLQKINKNSARTEEYFQSIVETPASTYYGYYGKGKDMESISVYTFPYYFTKKELKAMNLSTQDRIEAMNYEGLYPRTYAFKYDRNWDFWNVVKGRQLANNKRRKGERIPGIEKDDWLTPLLERDQEFLSKKLVLDGTSSDSLLDDSDDTEMEESSLLDTELEIGEDD